MSSTLIIAEAGVNHNGDLSKALLLIEKAAEIGADIVKFQTFNSSALATSSAEKAEYQKKNTKNNENQLKMLKSLELTTKDYKILFNHCRKYNIEFLSTAFDLDSFYSLAKFKLNRYKVPSGEITNLPYLREIAKQKTPIILSTGMSTLAEIEIASWSPAG